MNENRHNHRSPEMENGISKPRTDQIDLGVYIKTLEKRDGIWYISNHETISFPEEGYDLYFYMEDKHLWFQHRNRCIGELVEKYSQKNVFFDIGGGNGIVTKELIKRQIPAVLVEPGWQGCLNGKKRNLPHIACGSLSEKTFVPQSLPAVGMFDVIEHLEDDAKYIRTLHAIMQKDGLLFLTVPAYRSLWSNTDVYAGHYRRYTRKHLRDILHQHGFRVLYSTHFFSFLPPVLFLVRTIPYKLGFRKTTVFKRSQDVHKKPKRWSYLLHRILRVLLMPLLNMEVNRIKTGHQIPFGGSCMVLAQKI